jgi:hypothetical protein
MMLQRGRHLENEEKNPNPFWHEVAKLWISYINANDKSFCAYVLTDWLPCPHHPPSCHNTKNREESIGKIPLIYAAISYYGTNEHYYPSLTRMNFEANTTKMIQDSNLP